MTTTPNLALPYIMAAQAQKHVTHNEAIRALDAVVQIGVLDRDLTTPPTTPADGARYIVAASATGAWSGNAGKVAAWQDGAWMFYSPQEGWLAWIADEGLLAAWDGSAWVAAYGGVSLNPATGGLVGINTTADTTNRLAISAPATLLGHEGAGHQVKIVKDAAGDTASLLFQTDFSGRAEIGLTGDDDLHVKVSADGSTWTEALSVERATGRSVFKAIAQWIGDLFDGPVLWRYVPPTTDAAAPKFNFSVTSNPWTNGPGGEPNYWDHVAHFGWNFVGGTREDNTQAAFGLSFESKFYNGTVFGSEFHLQGEDVNGGPHRWLSFFLPHDGSGAGGSLSSKYLSMLDSSEDPKVEFNLDDGLMTLRNGMSILAEDNNTQFLRQKNAAGDTLKTLLYLTDKDDIRINGASWFVGARNPNATHSGSFVAIQPTSANSGDIMLNCAGPTLTGSIYGFQTSAAASTGLTGAIYNNSNTTTANALIELRTIGAGGGDPFVHFNVNGAQSWAAGIDNSDSDRFKISRSSAPGTNDAIAIDANKIEASIPFKLPSYTVSGKPSASDAGAGAMIYVTDETGGAVPAFSDGTDWLRVTDRAVVS